MSHDKHEFYRTLCDEELQRVVRRMEARAAVAETYRAWKVALELARAASEVIEEREER